MPQLEPGALQFGYSVNFLSAKSSDGVRQTGFGKKERDASIEMKLRLPSRFPIPGFPAALSTILLLTLFLAATTGVAHSESIPLERAIRLALSHSTGSIIAHTDVRLGARNSHSV